MNPSRKTPFTLAASRIRRAAHRGAARAAIGLFGAFLVSLTAAAAGGAQQPAGGPLQIATARLRQVGPSLTLQVQTAGSWRLRQLVRFPRPSSHTARFLCLSLAPGNGARTRELCLGARGRVGLITLRGDGSIASRRIISASVRRPTRSAAVLSFDAFGAGLSPGSYGWRVLSQWSGAECGSGPAPQSTCQDQFPMGAALPLQLRRVRVIGCTRRGPALSFRGPSRGRAVALSFDDGPSDYTPRVLATLRRLGAVATFFEVGDETPGHGGLMRRILDSGDEIGNHSTHHSSYPGFGDLVQTNHLITSSSGFTPCLFRPPNGAFNSATVGAASRAHLRTILWDVDPRDWSLPGAGAIYSRVVSAARPGSIVIMHDGGGNRSETLAALPRIIRTLRARGYAFETVTKLLGNRFIYRLGG